MEPLSDKEITSWSQRGDPIRAWYSYEMVRESLTQSRLNGLSCAVYPQGSYANKTNIVAESDVDMVIALRSAFYPDKTELSPPELREYARYYESGRPTWNEFREVVLQVLRSDYFLKEGHKAVRVRSGVMRLPADVLIALDHRYYKRFPSFESQSFVDGVQFYSSAGQKIVNYPKRHIRACAQKDRWTFGRYREVVRVAKNARNALIADDKTTIKSGAAPSYFLESLLWNVPSQCYHADLRQAYRQVMRWLQERRAPLGGMDFPSGMGKIFGDTPDASWNESDANQVIDAMYSQLTQ
jgi:hypothetical protein